MLCEISCECYFRPSYAVFVPSVGRPACGNRGLLTDVLRNQWGWDGFVVSDYDAWAMMYSKQHYVPSLVDAAATGMQSNVPRLPLLLPVGIQLCLPDLTEFQPRRRYMRTPFMAEKRS